MRNVSHIAKWFIIGEAVCELMLIPTSSFAGPGSSVSQIQSAGPVNPYCVIVYTVDDGTKYGFSINDPGAPQSLLAVNFSRQMLVNGINVPIIFDTGSFPTWANPKSNGQTRDCDGTVTYIWKIRY